MNVGQTALPGTPDKTLVSAGTYNLDPYHTLVTWRVDHMGFSMVAGQFAASSGSLTVDPDQPYAAKVEIAFDIGILTTPVALFTDHLKSTEFFDVANHPNARFKSTTVHTDGNHATIAGELTIKGITKPVTLDATFRGAGTDPTNQLFTIGFCATATIKRSDFDVAHGLPVIGDDVALIIDVAFVS